uniref:Vacuolar ATPase assembly integral membrane protein VMA21 homolog n=1 Tax=Panagrolaimus davidi TaxID=227884 RepID=A0A914Q4C6_9BILA
MTDEEYDAIYTEETRAKAIVLLIYFSILMVALPFASMYYCYHYVFNEYDASTDMLYSGLVAIAEIYILVAIFIFIAYKDEQTIEKRIKTKND